MKYSTLANNLHFVYVDHRAVARRLVKNRFGQYWAQLDWQDSAYNVANELQAEAAFDVAHHVSYGSLHVGSRLWRLNCPLVFGPVGGGQTAPAGFRRHLWGGWIAELLRTMIARYLYRYVLNARSTVRRAALVLVANRDTEEAVRALGARRVRFMTDVALTTEQITSRSPVLRSRLLPLRILWVARLQPRKGLLLALEAMARISSDTLWRLTVIGDGQQGVMLPKWLKALKLEDKVEWRGKMAWTEVQAGYDDADVFLFTSLRDTTGAQLLEAMGRGLPILALNHHGAATLVPDTAGIKVQVTSARQTAEGLARAIEKLARDRDLLAKMSLAAIEVAKKHTWDRRASEALTIYRDLIAYARP